MSINSLGSSYNNASSSVTHTNAPGIDQSGSTDTTKAGNSAATTSNNSVVVNISDSGKAASAQVTTEPSFKDVGMAARAKLDVLKQQAATKTGTTVSSLNIQQAGLMDYSSFSDQELAVMDLNSSGNFSKDEQDEAGGWLAERMRVSLETYRGVTNLGDRRGHAMTIDLLYNEMTPEVRSALGWTPTMMAANDHMLAGDEAKFGKLDISGVFENLRTTQTQGGLMFRGYPK
ncbi:MAG: hypothetical protein Q7R66_07150 [Undibacterium sp.]|uniref:hypothetical protein n=1 Tax=Undibacterium sp. TaxID=1914977 RepID=UPI00271A06AE|nr:hypothetical protein [Undibacterium sp.]MDO8651947.1 hypothetical protein [Undibacterium sp.]